MTRKCDDWITTYLEYVKNTESPTSYHTWTAFSTLGAACGHNYMNAETNFSMGNNLFILLIAKQGKTRKTTAIDVGIDLLEEVGQVTISPESVSKEALFLSMSQSKNDPHKESNYVVYAGEFSSMISTSGIDVVNFFIRVFDKIKSLKNLTIIRGGEQIDKPHITLMAATTPAQMRTGFGIDMRDNGLMSRTALIYESEPKQRLALGGKKDPEIKKMLVHDLREIAMMPRQELYFTDAARTFYIDWYQNTLAQEEKSASNPLEAAFISRKDLFMLKMSAICCISRDGDTISMDDLNRALDVMNHMQAGLGEVDSLLGTDKNLHVKEALLKTMEERKQVNMKDLTRMFTHEISNQEWTDILNHVTLAGYIRIEHKMCYWLG